MQTYNMKEYFVKCVLVRVAYQNEESRVMKARIKGLKKKIRSIACMKCKDGVSIKSYFRGECSNCDGLLCKECAEHYGICINNDSDQFLCRNCFNRKAINCSVCKKIDERSYISCDNCECFICISCCINIDRCPICNEFI